MEIAQDTVTVAGVLGALAPLAVAVVNHPRWSSQRKQVVAVVASVVIALVAIAVTGGFDDFSWANAGAALLTTVGAVQAAYALVWHPTGAAPAVERATSKGDVDLAA